MKIIYAMAALYPHGTAYASRVTNFARLLHSLGHEVVVFCDYLSDAELRAGHLFARFENAEIHYCVEKRNTLSKMTVMYRTPENIAKYIENNKVDLIIASSSSNRFARILKTARRFDIPIILESCEKYDPLNWKFKKADPRCWQFRNCWKNLYCKADGVIAISRLLEKHYSGNGKTTIRIPTILDTGIVPYRTEFKDEAVVKFVFTGVITGKKDLLVEFIQAMRALKGKTKRTPILNIYGPSKEQVLAQLGPDSEMLRELGDEVLIHGRVPQTDIPMILCDNDFGLLIRPRRESSDAGFPTKLAEYMAAGTPAFANDTGDIGLYIQNGESGVLFDKPDLECVSAALEAVLNMPGEDITKLRTGARKIAEKHFDYHQYGECLSELMRGVVHKQK